MLGETTINTMCRNNSVNVDYTWGTTNTHSSNFKFPLLRLTPHFTMKFSKVSAKYAQGMEVKPNSLDVLFKSKAKFPATQCIYTPVYIVGARIN